MQGSEIDAGQESGVGWRVKLREYLTVHADKRLPFGTVVDEFMPIIPRYEAERAWHKSFPNEDGVVAPNKKFQHMLQRELSRYPLRVVAPPRTYGRKWTRETTISAIARPCQFCREPFVAHHKTITCSPSHGSKLRWVEPDAQVSVEEGGEVEMNDRYPELRAVERIADVLLSVPQETWDRVIPYARHLAESQERPGPNLRLASDRDTAD